MDDQDRSKKNYIKHGKDFHLLGVSHKAIKYHEKRLKIALEIGDPSGEGRAYGSLGIAYCSLCDYRKAIEYLEKSLKIATERGDRGGEGRAYGGLGIAYRSLGDYRKAIEYLEKSLKIATEIGDRGGEGRAYGNLGNAYQYLVDYQKAVEYLEKSLKIATEIGDRGGVGTANGNLGNAYTSLGKYGKAIDCVEKSVKIAIEFGDRSAEGRAYGNLGSAYQSMGEFRKAIEYHEKCLKIVIGIGDRGGEGLAYGNLGIVYQLLSNYRKAIDYLKKSMKIAIDIGDRSGEGRANGNLAHAYYSQGDYRKAIEYHEKCLKIAISIGDRGGEGTAYRNFGIAYNSLGNYRKAIDYLGKAFKIATELGDRRSEEAACGNLGNAYQNLGDYRKAIEYHEKSLKIAIAIGERDGEGNANGNLGNAYNSLGNYRKAIDYNEKSLKIAMEIGHRFAEGRACGNLGTAYESLGDYRKAIKCYEKNLKIAIEIGDRDGEGTSYHNIASAYFSLEQFENAVDNFISAVNVFNFLRSLLKSKDNWKIKYRELYEKTYTALWRSFLRTGKVDEALSAAEQGRAQTLSDNLLIQFKLPASLSTASSDTEGTISRLSAEIITPTIFLGIDGPTINIWFLRRKNKVVFRQGRLEGDRTEKDPIHALVQSSLVKIGTEDPVRCEDRTFDELDNEQSFSLEAQAEEVGKRSSPPLDNPFRPFYDAIIDPIADMLGPQDDELVIVPDGALCLTPWAAVIESIRIRTLPSLTSYQLILSAPEGHHRRKGALLVGNPCLSQLKKPEPALPCAQEEVEMIASILNTTALVGRQAIKAEVMKQISSVGLIHIAAHGNKRTGEIALSPNPGWTSSFPQKKDYILKMSDVQEANLRARLVVLSCCHSGRGRISKGEGVVGIARAFLVAGARSVLVSLWAIDDEATMVFMKSFYQHLKEGKTASSAVQESMKFLRESMDYSEMKYWAPFQLIGDDVKIEFEADDDVKK